MGVVVGYFILAAAGFGAYATVGRRKKEWPYKKYLLALALVGILCMAVSLGELLTDTSTEVFELKRKEAGEGATDVELILDAEGLLSQYAYPVSVEEQQLTSEEAEQLFAAAGQELEEKILGENVFAEEVSSDLSVPKQLQEGKVDVSCYFDPYELVEQDGKICWDQLEEDTALVKVTAQMSCQEREVVHEFYLELVPPPLGAAEAVLAGIRDSLAAENEKPGQEYVQLPQEAQGIPLKWKESRETSHGKVLVLGLAALVGWYVYERERKERQQKEWRQKLILDYPDIVSQLSLLVGAGMTVPAAWTKLAREYEGARKSGRMELRPGFEELQKTCHELRDGVGELMAYENFGRRCDAPSYRKFASLLMQNVRKGTKGMQQILDVEARDAFLERKLYAKKMGEEAGTKLLVPMGIMLLLVFAILMLPAMISLGV